MPDRKTTDAARKDLREGKSASTAAGEFVREEMHHIREGKHGAANTKQAIAIGLSKARRAGVPLNTRNERDEREEEEGRMHHTPSASRSRATRGALKKKGHRAASHAALSKQARSTQRRRGHAARSASARKAARTRARSR